MAHWRELAWYVGAGLLVTGIVGLADGPRGLLGAAAAWVVCLATLVFPRRRLRVAVPPGGPKIGGGWGLLPAGEILFRLAWTLCAGFGLYIRFGADLGVGFWVALLSLYQVVLALRLARLLRRPAAVSGDRVTDAPG